MCFGERESWLSLVFGTITNLAVLSALSNSYMPMFLIIEFTLLMQLWEALAWRDPSCGRLNAIATKGAMISNVLQPIAIFLAFYYFGSADKSSERLATMIIVIYAIATAIFLYKNISKHQCMRATIECKHLQLDWWADSYLYLVMYLVALFSVSFLMIRPIRMKWFFLLYILFTDILSQALYACSWGGVWCWSLTFAPVMIYLMELIIKP
jgi:hypothetical protein